MRYIYAENRIRLVELENTAVLDENGNGGFCFKVNRKKSLSKGTNWLPLDAFHSRDIERLPQSTELLDDIGCNMVRCWGGNVYESDAFFDFCDAHGIMVWQDFAMGCAVYPQERRFYEKLEPRGRVYDKRLRNHPHLLYGPVTTGETFAIKAGSARKDPNKTCITREILPRIVEEAQRFYKTGFLTVLRLFPLNATKKACYDRKTTHGR